MMVKLCSICGCLARPIETKALPPSKKIKKPMIPYILYQQGYSTEMSIGCHFKSWISIQ